MKAEITLVNPNRDMIAARSEDGEFVILEIVGEHNIEIGDIISNKEFHTLGSEEYYNHSKSESFAVFVQNVCGSLEQAKKQCFL